MKPLHSAALVIAAGMALAHPLSAQPYRSIDGTGNNIANPTWGAANTPILRLWPAAYENGYSTPTGFSTLPSARAVSIQACQEGFPNLPERPLAHTVMQWGQFITHDLGFKNTQEPADAFPVPVPAWDTFFDPQGTGTKTLPFFRSKFQNGTGSGPGNPRQQMSFVSSFIDANTVYGSNPSRAAALRTFTNGKLLTQSHPTGDLLPFNTVLEPMDGSPFGSSNLADLMLVGDNRANTQVLLLAVHTIWVREHNRLCDVLKAANPTWNDEKLYQEARKRVAALCQVITFNEYLPAILGEGSIPAYTGYKPTVNPTVSNEFSHAAFRFAHSQTTVLMQRLGEDGVPIPEGNLRMRDQFFLPNLLLTDGGIEPLLRGMAFQPAQEVDLFTQGDLRNFLYGDPNSKGHDLAAFDIQRGRDHGLPLYTQARIYAGLSPITSFEQISANPDTIQRLQTAYTSVDQIDVWVGGLAEDHVPGSSLGPLFHKIILDDFVRVRDGDRFWYQNPGEFSAAEVAELGATTFTDVIKRNTTIQYMQPNNFFAWPDIDRDYQLTINDFITFQTYFAIQDPLADFDKNGVLNIDDFITFQTVFATFF
jgi:peroxidase